MDFQKYVDGFGAMTCIVSVENLGNGERGKFRIVTGYPARFLLSVPNFV